jgi:hypothetical protein
MEASRLRLGALTTLASLAFAGIVGLIAVGSADSVASSFGRGLGIALLVFLSGATLVCALACLARGRAEIGALGGIVAAGLTVDLLVLALWLDIQSTDYGRVVGIAFVWSIFALVALGLTLAVSPREPVARLLYGSAVGAAILAGLISTWLILKTGASDLPSVAGVGGSSSGVGNDELLRLLGALLVALGTLWFSAIAAGRLQRS